MKLSENKAVDRAYDANFYVDAKGNEWRRGMDGWFLLSDDPDIFLIRHHDMIAKIEKEHPDGQ